MARVVAVVASLLLAIGAATFAMTASPAAATPGGPPWVVTLGDSYISGEAGRWAGNTNRGEQYVDALGPTAYFDNATNTGEQIPRCHRSKSAEAYIGGAVDGLNLACSGARTSTFTDGDGNFKPGLDFYDDGNGHKGQALALQEFAAANDVELVVVSIGGNDFGFASIVQTCVLDFLLSPSWWPDYCKDDGSVTANFTAANVAAKTTAISTAVTNVHQAMANAGYSDTEYTILVQTYPSPVPNGSGFRYPQTGYTRQTVGGCGFWNADADWANATAVPTINGAVRNGATQTGFANVKIMELTSAFNGRRLCERSVGLLEEKALASWTSRGAVNKTEWIDQIRTTSTIGSDYYVQESLHPNYWGQLALRNCVRQAYNGGVPRGGTCMLAGKGLNAVGEPLMSLQ